MLKAKRELGQNFLTNKDVVQKIIQTADVSEEDTIIEIGAGTGVLTKELARTAKTVIAVEFDRDLIPVLEKKLKQYKNVEIKNRDILKINFSDLSDTSNKLETIKIIGSIPFQITSPLIHKLIYENRWKLATLLIQKEVAKKITATPPQANYLSIFVQSFTTTHCIKTVPKTAFSPVPEVDGAIINLEWEPRQIPAKPKVWSTFLHKGFKHPRKMLRNIFDKSKLEEVNINPRSRPQELTITEWINLHKNIQRTTT